jgi:hypothetical protein
VGRAYLKDDGPWLRGFHLCIGELLARFFLQYDCGANQIRKYGTEKID